MPALKGAEAILLGRGRGWQCERQAPMTRAARDRLGHLPAGRELQMLHRATIGTLTLRVNHQFRDVDPRPRLPCPIDEEPRNENEMSDRDEHAEHGSAPPLGKCGERPTPTLVAIKFPNGRASRRPWNAEARQNERLVAEATNRGRTPFH